MRTSPGIVAAEHTLVCCPRRCGRTNVLGVRRAVIGWVILCGSCGGRESSPQGSAGASYATVHMLTTGEGLIRGAGTDCRRDCTAIFTAGTRLRLDAIPDVGATFDGWSGACSGIGPCQLTVTRDVSVSAAFSQTAPPPAR
jgi:List-Bact-rpt repeat protein